MYFFIRLGEHPHRFFGDPFFKQEALLLLTTSLEAPVKVELEQSPNTITKDFLNRIEGKPSLLTTEDIVLATLGSIHADEQVRLIQ